MLDGFDWQKSENSESDSSRFIMSHEQSFATFSLNSLWLCRYNMFKQSDASRKLVQIAKSHEDLASQLTDAEAPAHPPILYDT